MTPPAEATTLRCSNCGADAEYGWTIAPGEPYETFWQHSPAHGAFVDDPLDDDPRRLSGEELGSWRECPACEPPVLRALPTHREEGGITS